MKMFGALAKFLRSGVLELQFCNGAPGDHGISQRFLKGQRLPPCRQLLQFSNKNGAR
jgi:hypothetical protein